MSDSPNSGNDVAIGKIILDTGAIAASRASVVADSAKMTAALNSVGAASGTLQGRINAIIPNARQFGQDAGIAAKQAELLTNAQLNSASSSVKAAAGFKLQVEGLRPLASLLTQLGAGGAGSTVRVVSEVGRVANAAESFAPQIDAMAHSLENAGGIVGRLAEDGSHLSDIIPGISSGFGSILGVGVPLVGVLGGAAIIFKSLSDTITDGNDAVAKATSDLVAYYQLIATGTADQIKAEIAKQKIIKESNDQAIGDTRGKLDKIIQAQVDNPALGTDRQSLAEATKNANSANLLGHFDPLQIPGMQQLLIQLGELQTKSDAAKKAIDDANKAIGSDAVVRRDDAIQALKNIKDRLDQHTQENALLNLSSDAAKQKAIDLTKDIDLNRQAANSIKNSGDKSDEASKQLNAYNETIHKDQVALDFLNNTGIKAIAIKEAEAKAAADLIKTNDALVAAVTKRDADIKAINDKETADEVALKQKTADTIAGIIQKAIDGQDAALLKLNNAKEDLNTSNDRDAQKSARAQDLEDVKTEIQSRATLRDDLVAHLRKVRDINLADQAQTNQDLNHRNFLALFELQESHRQQQKAEQTASDEKIADDKAKIAQDAQIRLLDRSAQANETRIAIQNKLADLQLGYNREIDQLRANKTREINLTNSAASIELSRLHDNLTAQLNARNSAAKVEIGIITQTEAQKLAVYRNMLLQASALAPIGTTAYQNAALNQVANQHILGRAGGGNVPAGSWFKYNEPESSGRESFAGMRLPAGSGIAFAAKSGNVDPKGGAQNITLVFNVPNAMDEKKLASFVGKEVNKLVS